MWRNLRDIYPMYAQLACSPALALPWHLRHDPPAMFAEIERRDALRVHILRVAMQAETVAEFAAALKADGTLDALG
jgi:hypothetical protein